MKWEYKKIIFYDDSYEFIRDGEEWDVPEEWQKSRLLQSFCPHYVVGVKAGLTKLPKGKELHIIYNKT